MIIHTHSHRPLSNRWTQPQTPVSQPVTTSPCSPMSFGSIRNESPNKTLPSNSFPQNITHQVQRFTGPVHLSNQHFDLLEIDGDATLSNITAQQIRVHGSLRADHVTVDRLHILGGEGQLKNVEIAKQCHGSGKLSLNHCTVQGTLLADDELTLQESALQKGFTATGEQKQIVIHSSTLQGDCYVPKSGISILDSSIIGNLATGGKTDLDSTTLQGDLLSVGAIDLVNTTVSGLTFSAHGSIHAQHQSHLQEIQAKQTIHLIDSTAHSLTSTHGNIELQNSTVTQTMNTHKGDILLENAQAQQVTASQHLTLKHSQIQRDATACNNIICEKSTVNGTLQSADGDIVIDTHSTLNAVVSESGNIAMDNATAQSLQASQKNIIISHSQIGKILGCHQLKSYDCILQNFEAIQAELQNTTVHGNGEVLMGSIQLKGSRIDGTLTLQVLNQMNRFSIQESHIGQLISNDVTDTVNALAELNPDNDIPFAG